MTNKLLILDRDGVVNRDSPDYVKSVDEWQPIPGSLEAIARLSRAGYTIAVVSNQSGLARGLFDRSTLDAIHWHMNAEVERAGGKLAGVFVCPHRQEDGCACRKPEIGLLREVERSLGVEVARAVMVGDKPSDLETARRARCEALLVRTGKGATTEHEGVGLEGVLVFDDLAAVAEFLIARD